MTAVREVNSPRAPRASASIGKAREPRVRRRREVWFQLHLWIGWIAALPLLALCVTGIALSFEEELYALEQPEHFALTPGAARLSLPDVLDRYEAARPRLHLNYLQVPHSDREAYLAFATELGEGDAPDRGLRAYLDPYTGAITREYDNPTFVRKLEVWHRTLGAGKTGRWIMGGSALLLAVTSVAGAVLWWPMRGRTFVRAWRRGGALNWHNALGVVALLPLVILGITGATFTWGKHVYPALDALQGKPSLATPPELAGNAGDAEAESAERVSLAWVAEKIEREFPDRHIVGLQGSRKASKPYVFNLRAANDFHPGGNLRVFFDPRNGKEALRTDPSDTGPVGWYRRYFYILHTGHPFPIWARSLWGVASLVGCVLVVTGLWLSVRRWRRRRAADNGETAHA